MSTEQFKEYAERLTGCCFHENDWPIQKIVKVIAWVESENDGPSGGAIVQFEDGRYGSFEESQDYTGHG